jgi:hypothetical protein
VGQCNTFEGKKFNFNLAFKKKRYAAPMVFSMVVTGTITDGRMDGRLNDGRWVVRDLDAL